MPSPPFMVAVTRDLRSPVKTWKIYVIENLLKTIFSSEVVIAKMAYYGLRSRDNYYRLTSLKETIALIRLDGPPMFSTILKS